MKEKIQKYSREIAIILIIILLGLGIGALGLKEYFNDKNKIEEKEIKSEKSNKEEKTDKKKESECTPLLYKVTKDGSDTTMYLFGSIHVADDRAYPLPEKVMNAYNNSDYLAVEFDMVAYASDYKKQVESLQTLVLTDGTMVTDHLSDETYQLMVKYLKDNNLYNSMYDYYKPAIHYSLISSIQTELSKLDSDLGIDMYFLEKAHKENKEILEVESATSQYEVLGSLPDELYDFLINSSIIYEESMIEETNDLYEAWLKGDAEYIIELSSSEDTELLEDYDDYKDLVALLEDYDKALIDDRNVSMTEKATEYFEEGKNVFFVVGLAHIVGEGAIADNLQNLGYTVELVEYK